MVFQPVGLIDSPAPLERAAMSQMVTALIGPTAAGKTDVSIALAKQLGAEIVGCDSMQVYRRLPILSQQPSPEQRAAVPHHLIDCVEPNEVFNVGRYRTLALAAIAEIRRRGGQALIVGGTGLYLKALMDGLCDAPPSDASVRMRLTRELEDRGRDALHEELSRVDPAWAARSDARNPRRIVRALEVYRISGRPLSSFWSASEAEGLSIAVVGLARSSEDLYDRINRRVERMIRDEGVLEEARQVLGLALSHTARQVHGLRFLEAYARGTSSMAETVTKWQQQVRNYAKRQMTWFRADPRIRWISVASDETTDSVVQRLLGGLQYAEGVAWNAPS